MITVTLENEGNMLRTELPKPLDNLIDDLGSVGITIPLKDIKISKESPYNIRLYSDSVLGQAVIERLNQNPGISEARCLAPWIPEQPDLDIKTKPLKEVKFYCPLEIEQILDEEDDWEEYSDEPVDLPSYYALPAVRDINLAIEKYASPCKENRGIMAYLGDREMLGKVYSIFPSVERQGDDICGVFTCQLYDDLDSYELEALRSELSGQASDGNA